MNQLQAIVPIEIETRNSRSLHTLVFAPDNRHLFSGGYEGDILRASKREFLTNLHRL